MQVLLAPGTPAPTPHSAGVSKEDLNFPAQGPFVISSLNFLAQSLWGFAFWGPFGG